MTELADRFWSRVDKNGPVLRPELGQCWIWTGAIFRLRGGYGAIGVLGHILKAHRFAFLLEHGREPGPVLRHACDNPPCVRPSHLLEGTHADNVRDKVDRDRVPFGEGHHASKLTAVRVRELRARRGQGVPIAALASEFGISQGNVSMICAGKRWARA